MQQEISTTSLVTDEATQIETMLSLMDEAATSDMAIAFADELIRIGEQAVEPLIQALSRPQQQLFAQFTLGLIGDARATEPLLDLMAEWIAAGRREVLSVITALGRIGDRRAVVPLLELLATAEQHALKEAEPPSILHSNLVEVFASWFVRHKRGALSQDQIEQQTRQELLLFLFQALGRIGDSRAVEPIRTRLADPDPVIGAMAQRVLDQLDGNITNNISS